MREVSQAELNKNTQKLLDGPLKHVRAAALAAVLVPLASLVATPASAQSTCASGGVCGLVFNDVNMNGIQDAGDAGLEGFVVTISDNSGPLGQTNTDSTGAYYFTVPPGTYTITVTPPPGSAYVPSPPNQGSDDTVDSDGVPDGFGNSVAANMTLGFNDTNTDFGFFVNQTVTNPGTGTLGYWKNHPGAWPAGGVTIAGVNYSASAAIYWMNRVGKDKTTLMFAQLVAAKLNVGLGNDPSCIASTIAAADGWLTTYPVGSNVAGGSAAWAVGDPIASTLDAYNNGQMCAPHRN